MGGVTTNCAGETECEPKIKYRRGFQGFAYLDRVSLQRIKAEHDSDLSAKGLHVNVEFPFKGLMVVDYRNEASWKGLVLWDKYGKGRLNPVRGKYIVK